MAICKRMNAATLIFSGAPAGQFDGAHAPEECGHLQAPAAPHVHRRSHGSHQRPRRLHPWAGRYR